MTTLDRVNARFGSGTLQPGVAGLQELRGWAMKRGNKSPAYTTRLGGSGQSKAGIIVIGPYSGILER
jgi:DNA polymerase V